MVNIFKRAPKRKAESTEIDIPSPPSGTAAKRRKTFPSGIKLLHESENCIADIIFVHGLTGDREKTWTAKDAASPWPEALLPAKVPDARILTFGYDAYVTALAGVVSNNRIRNHAMNLLSAVAAYRDEDETSKRPLIFVCHSLGGLVCEDAIVEARDSSEDHLRNIYNSTHGILFLGTPHRGSGLAAWAEKLATSIGILKQTNSALISTLRKESEVLERIQGSFHSMIRSRYRSDLQPIDITCFYEELPLPGVGVVVPQESAILPSYISIGIRSNHMEMTKFEGEEDPGFLSVTGELRRWMKRITQRNLDLTRMAMLQKQQQDTYPHKGLCSELDPFHHEDEDDIEDEEEHARNNDVTDSSNDEESSDGDEDSDDADEEGYVRNSVATDLPNGEESSDEGVDRDDDMENEDDTDEYSNQDNGEHDESGFY